MASDFYDGSFEGFLCCVFESFAQHEIPFAVWTPQRETATLYPVRDIETDSARAQRVFSALGRKLGRETEYLISRDFLSGQEDKELLLIRFLHLAFALGPGTVKRMGHPDVAPLYEMKKSLDWEVDKFQGFVRFEEHGGMLGAVIHPKNYILPLLRGHFCSRFPEESFMIYDAVHQAVLLYQEHKAQLLELAALAEHFSTHPISRSIQAACPEADFSRVTQAEELPGRGVRAVVDGRTVLAGNGKLMKEFDVAVSEDGEPAGTVVYVAADGQYLGRLVVADQIKESAPRALQMLKAEGVGRTVMLTGDAPAVGQAVGRTLGLDEVHAGLLPGDKVERVEQLLAQKRSGEQLVFVGDGINDAPVLSRADVGVAMGAMGSDAAIEAADVVLMDDQPSKIATAMRISKKTISLVSMKISCVNKLTLLFGSLY